MLLLYSIRCGRGGLLPVVRIGKSACHFVQLFPIGSLCSARSPSAQSITPTLLKFSTLLALNLIYRILLQSPYLQPPHHHRLLLPSLAQFSASYGYLSPLAFFARSLSKSSVFYNPFVQKPPLFKAGLLKLTGSSFLTLVSSRNFAFVQIGPGVSSSSSFRSYSPISLAGRIPTNTITCRGHNLSRLVSSRKIYKYLLQLDAMESH